jgi:hypothetical protein
MPVFDQGIQTLILGGSQSDSLEAQGRCRAIRSHPVRVVRKNPFIAWRQKSVSGL